MLPPLLDLCVWNGFAFRFFFTLIVAGIHGMRYLLFFLVVVIAKILTKVAASAADFVVI